MFGKPFISSSDKCTHKVFIITNIRYEFISSEVAEICGIHAGDGHLRKNGKEFEVSGGIEEKDYYVGHVIPLFNRAFNLSIKGKYFKSKGTYGFRTSNSHIINTLKGAGFKLGNKTLTASVPKQILYSKDLDLITAFLRGYFDTDGCFTFDKKIGNPLSFHKTRNYYPRILFTTCSKNLAKNLKYLVQLLGFKAHTYVYIPKVPTENKKYKMQIVGVKALNL
ncbi:MAG: LAGLIDADG family homing endonuclease, partial [Candidatus Nanoarchaeia archaeon]